MQTTSTKSQYHRFCESKHHDTSQVFLFAFLYNLRNSEESLLRMAATKGSAVRKNDHLEVNGKLAKVKTMSTSKTGKMAVLKCH